MRDPEFGLDLSPESDADRDLLVDLGAGRDGPLTFLRLHGHDPSVLLGGEVRPLDDSQLERLEGVLPAPYRLKSGTAIPDTVSLDMLIGRKPGPLTSRPTRMKVVKALNDSKVTSATIAEQAPAVGAILDDATRRDAGRAAAEALGRKLLIDVVRIDPKMFEDLEEALAAEEEGRADSLIAQMNHLLATHLNLTRWWTQDRDFDLRLARSEHEVVFTVADKTGRQYSFRERSTGLRYFLSYFVQLRVHEAPEGRSELLLLDEPDAYLSSHGQQDLLRVLEDFARPEGTERRNQVVYVTHSPFLLNKNAPRRIRVLDKGGEDEGTRVVRDAAQNHYEPLRSSIGTFAAETAFIAGSNLFVEGPSDQVLIAGATSRLHRRRTAPSQLVDLNEVTIVEAGGAQNLPYMTYLARGRDSIKPACVVLVDGDDEGRDAARRLKRDEVNRKRLLDDDCVVDLGEWAKTTELKLPADVEVVETEDLIPIEVSVHALRGYARHLLGLSDEQVERLTKTSITKHLDETTPRRTWPAVRAAFSDAYDGAEIAKVGYAKEVVDWIAGQDGDNRAPGLAALDHNFGALIAHLADRLRRAAATEADRRRDRKLGRLVDGFLERHPDGASRDSASTLLRDIEASLDENSDTAQPILAAIASLRKHHRLRTDDPLADVPEYDGFRRGLKNLKPLERMAASGTVTVA